MVRITVLHSSVQKLILQLTCIILSAQCRPFYFLLFFFASLREVTVSALSINWMRVSMRKNDPPIPAVADCVMIEPPVSGVLLISILQKEYVLPGTPVKL